ncbi:Eukaryotic translation initiation factor 4 gamma 2 [Sciurus carolinensis]|uniref:Eukaryotic translation initiation factor 4 gamma 2 n=3 Tax=Euarchontoglires TaxID=314146 RepID=A0AA41MPG2_SCICA|nr:Eukaryotic translation initiation factor 4 gamma 2 [Sciurus carolinensis]
MAAAVRCLKWRSQAQLGTAALQCSPAAAEAVLSITDGAEVERRRWVLRRVHVVVSVGDRQGRERSPAARVGSNRKHAPRWGGVRAARTCDREAPRVAGPAASRGDCVEKHLGAGRAALTHSSLAFVIGLHSDPALQPEGGVHSWTRPRVEATGRCINKELNAFFPHWAFAFVLSLSPGPPTPKPAETEDLKTGCRSKDEEGKEACTTRALGHGFWEQRAYAGRRGNHTNALRRALQLLRKRTAAQQRSARLTPLAWTQSLREYGFAHCGGAAPQPSLALWLLPAALRGLVADGSQAADWVAKEPFGAALILRCQAAKVESAIAEGGASRFSEFLGKTPGQNAQKWIPARSTRRDDNSAANNSANEKERHDAIFRKVRGILNKLTPEKFDKLCLELLNVGVESKLILKGVILLIVDKALEEPKYSSLYAQLCLRLAEDAPNFDGPAAEGQPGQKQSTTFRRLLISKLQDEFENRTRNVDVYDKRENPLLPEEEEQRAIAKIKMLGNIKFIGELGKLDLIHESILHKCIKTLLEKKKRVQLKDMGEDLECLCQIMRTVGPRLDHERAKSLMDQYFARMCSLMLSKELPARIRFLLQDTVELREHHWVPRKAFLDNGPKTINQIRQDAVKDLGVFIPAPMAQGMRNDFFLEAPFMPPRMKMDRDPLGGLADMFGQMPGSGIGTGPGVIQDRFSPTMGRHRSNQLFNGHGGHIMPPTQSQFGEMGGKFMKSQGLSQLYHNQSQGLLSQLQGQSKDMPPRFSKKGQLNADEISLRPAQSFLMNKNQVPKLQPQITMIPPSAQPPRTQTPPLGQTPQLGLKTNPPLIQEKPAKTSKKPPPSKEELLKLTETVVTEYLNSGNANEAVNGVREMRAPKHFLPEMLSKVIILSLDRSDEDKEKASSLISLLKQEGIATSDNFMQAFLNVLDQCPKLEVDIPLVKSYLAQFAARAIISELVSISELAQPLESGTHFPLFLLCLQQLAKLQDREWLTELFQQSKVNMQKMLPEIDQNKDRMLEILEGKGLSFLFPLLKLEKELLKQIKLDPSPQTIYKWIKDNISPKLHVDKGFVNILMTSFLQYISSEVSPPSDETDSSSAPSKEQLEQEKQLLLSFKPVMQKFLHDHVDLQVSALYALQVHCYNSNFPKGMLLRFFVHFYDMEIIEEEAFLAWKEDITQEFPGKGKALFQVNFS